LLWRSEYLLEEIPRKTGIKRKMVGATGFEPATSSSQIERNFLIHSIFQQFLIDSILFGAVSTESIAKIYALKIFFDSGLVHQNNTRLAIFQRFR
jgi:hypothetical protein